jgi:PAP2 superfamily C-terminal
MTGRILLALAGRYASFVAMCALALLHEGTRGPTLYDPLLELLPYVAWVDRANWWLWLALYLPLALAFLCSEPERWIRYMWTGALVSLARGLCIAATQLGPPDPAHTGAGIGARGYGRALYELVSPFHVFVESSQRAYLTQDLFFSGHAATTFLLWLYLRGRRWLGPLALAGHLVSVAAVLLAHLHYTIDVLGAWAATWAIYALRERRAGA